MPANPTQLWLPLGLRPNPAGRGNHGLYAAAHLSPGASAAQASEELKAITDALTREGHYHREMEFEAFAVPLEEEILGEVRPAILILLVASASLLAIACANVGGLLLARSETRRREIALRNMLGAGRGRLARQLMTESLVLAAVGMLAGVGLAFAGIRILASWPLHASDRSTTERLPGTLQGGAVLRSLSREDPPSPGSCSCGCREGPAIVGNHWGLGAGRRGL
jgi:putative ABC transport system permease protein